MEDWPPPLRGRPQDHEQITFYEQCKISPKMSDPSASIVLSWKEYPYVPNPF
jgi:hypothetical protein